MTVIFYNGSEVEGRKVYKGLLDLEPLVDQTKEIPYETLNTLNVSVSLSRGCHEM